MVKTGRNDDLTVLCRNASPKYCAPWSPILLYDRSSVVSVCVKETGMSEWRRRWWNVAYSEKGWVSAYTSVLLVRQENNASDLTGRCSEWMCKLYGAESVVSIDVHDESRVESVSQKMYLFLRTMRQLLMSDEWILIVEL